MGCMNFFEALTLLLALVAAAAASGLEAAGLTAAAVGLPMRLSEAPTSHWAGAVHSFP